MLAGGFIVAHDFGAPVAATAGRIDFVGVGTNSATTNVAVPAGTATGDLELLWVGGESSAVSGCTGWTFLMGSPGFLSQAPQMIAYRWASASEPASYPCAAAKDAAAIVVYRGVDTSEPVDVATPLSVRHGGGAADTFFPTAETTASGSVVVRTLAHDAFTATGGAPTAPTGHTLRSWGTGLPTGSTSTTYGGIFDIGATPDSSLSPALYKSPSGFFHQTASSGTTITMSLSLHASGSALRPSILAKALLGGGSEGARNLCMCHRSAGDPVDLATGNYYERATDLRIPGRGPSINFTRTYNSQPGQTLSDSMFGYGWSAQYDQHVTVPGSTATIAQAGGAEISFTNNGSTWDPAVGVTSTLTDQGTTWKLVRNATEILVFDKTTGRLNSLADQYGNTTTLTYDGSGHLSSVTDPAGRTVTVNFTGAHVTSIVDFTGRTVTYGYSGAGDLTDVTDVRGGHWQYTYDSSHRLLTARSARFFGDTTTSPTPVTTNHYDAQGRVDTQTDPLGNTTSFDYTTLAATRGTLVTDANGNQNAYYYDASGFLVAETHGYNGTASTTFFAYDPNTLGVTETLDDLGQVTATTYDSAGNVTSRQDPAGHTWQWGTYNAFNEPSSSTDANGVTTTYSYDNTNGNLQSVSTPCKQPDGVTNCSAGATATTSYGHASGSHPDDLTSVTDANGNTTTFTYDSDGNLTEADSNTLASLGGAKLVTKYTYDRVGRRVSTVRPEGNKTGGTPNQHRDAVLYDNAGLALSTIDPLAQPQVDTFTRGNAASLGSSETGAAWTVIPSGAAWSVSNGAAKLTTVSGIRNMAVVNAYADGTFALTDTAAPSGDNFGLTFRVQDVSNFWTLRAFPSSSHWRLYKTIAGTSTLVGSSSTGTCCSANQRISVTTSGSSIKAYLASSTSASPTLMISATDSALSTATQAGIFGQNANDGAATNFTTAKAGGGVTTTIYDADGDTTSAGDANGKVTGYVYDSADQLTTVNRANSTTLSYTYDDIGNRTSYSDGNSHTTTWSYSNRTFPHSPTSMQPPSPVTTMNYDYDELGRLSVVTDLAASKTATYTYDAASRPTAIAYSDSSTPSVTAISYDDDGRRLSLTEDNGIGTSTWSYDSLGRVASSQLGGAGLGVSYDYDLKGNTTKIVYPNETNPVVQCYDEADRLTKIYDPTVASATCSSTGNSAWAYDYDSNITSVTYQNGVTDTRTYNANDQNTQMETKFGATSYGKFVYTRDAANQLASTATTGTNLAPTGTENYSRNNLNQLSGTTGASARTYSYDNGDNITRNDTQYQQFNAANELCWQTTTATGNSCASVPTGATTYSYDSYGSRHLQTVGATTTTYNYDQQHRLSSISGPVTASYTYTADGTRLSKTVSGTATDFTYSSTGSIPLLLQTQSGGAWTSYIYGPDGIAFERKNSSVYRITTHDQIGSIRVTTDSAGGNQGTYSYDPYGKVIAHNGLASSLQYAGEYVDGESGFYALRARYYDPTTAQFITRDPAINTTLDPYGYVGNRPLDAVDPTGKGLCLDWSWLWGDNDPNCQSLVDEHPVGAQQIADFGAGMLDTITFGNEQSIDSALGQADHVNRCSGYYTGGKIAGGVALALLAPGIGEEAAAEEAATATVETTAHGATRIAGEAATRGGVLDEAEISLVRGGGTTYAQSNGAIARVLTQADGRFSVVIDGERGLITSFKNLSQNALERLAKKYGWTAE